MFYFKMSLTNPHLLIQFSFYYLILCLFYLFFYSAYSHFTCMLFAQNIKDILGNQEDS